MKRTLGAILAGSGLAALFWLATEGAPTFAPWTDPLPRHAQQEGYNQFRGPLGRALPSWDEAYFRQAPPSPAGPLLVDRYHASKQPETSRLDLDDYSYDSQHGFQRAFRPAVSQGVKLVQVREPWTPGVLAGASAVFINLVSGDNPRLTWAEARALEAFVRAGGGLILIVDHTNCYFHGELIQPLTSLLGVKHPPATATDRGLGNTLSTSSVAWVRVRKASEHPVTEGVDSVGWMTGGMVVGGTPLLQGSARGWADRWTPYRRGDSSGFTGDLTRQDDEAAGPNAVAVALEVGEGRVVVVADQNAFGSTMIGLEESGRFFTNAVGWVTRRDLSFETRGRDSLTTLCGRRMVCTTAADSGFRSLQVQVQKVAEYDGVEEFATDSGATQSRLLVFLPDSVRDDLPALLEGADRVLAVVDPRGEGSRRLLAALGLGVGQRPAEEAPGFKWERALEALPSRAFKGAPELEPLPVAPVPLYGEVEVLAQDTRGRPLVVRKGKVTLVLDPRALSNEILGDERAHPDEGARGAGLRLALRLAHDLCAPGAGP